MKKYGSCLCGGVKVTKISYQLEHREVLNPQHVLTSHNQCENRSICMYNHGNLQQQTRVMSVEVL